MLPFLPTTDCELQRRPVSTGKSDLQKPLTGPQTMGSRASLSLVLLLLVSAPLSVLAEGTENVAGNAVGEVHDAQPTEAERLMLAAAHWNMMPQATMVPVALMPATGVLHLALGSFDPLLGNGPEVPAGYDRINDVAHTGMVMVQLDAPDGTVLDRLVKQYDLTVLDVLHDEGWLVRLPAEHPEVIDALGDEEGSVG